MNPSPKTLRAKARNRLTMDEDVRAYDAHADAWEAALLALWFEHYKDVYPEGRIDHGDCTACRLLDALAAVEHVGFPEADVSRRLEVKMSEKKP